MILPPPCLVVGLVFLGLKASPSLLQTYFCSVFLPSDHRTFLQKAFKLEWSFKVLLLEEELPSSWILSAHADIKPCGHWQLCSSSFSFIQTCFLMILGWLLTILTNGLSAAGDSLCFLPDGGSNTTGPWTLFWQIILDLKLLWNGSKWLSDLFKSMICFFQIFAELLRFSHCSVWV